MFIAVIHWRVKPDQKSLNDFREHWNKRNAIDDRDGLIGEFLSEALASKDYPYITWHLDPESSGDFKSYVTVGLWSNPEAFAREVARHFNDDEPILAFEKYRRRRVVFAPVGQRIGMDVLPKTDSEGVV
jgi:hypothetical protein